MQKNNIPKHLNLKNKWKFIKKFKTKDDFDKFCQVLADRMKQNKPISDNPISDNPMIDGMLMKKNNTD